MIDTKSKFENITGVDSFHRVNNTHPLDLYMGLDGMSRYTLFLIAESEPIQLYSSQIINVQVGFRSDKKWGLSFSLVNNKFADVFFHFCNDIIESSCLIKNKNQGEVFVCSRYLQWQNMFSKYNAGLLSEPSIKGLIGELYFLSNYLIPFYGEERALNSWIGPDKAKQDFVIDNTWFEVKSIVSGAECVKISSIEQLDTSDDGELIVIYLDKTSFADESKITLNGIYKSIIDNLPNHFLQQKLNDILLNLGYYCRAEYDEYIFKFSGIERYTVNENFPSLRRSTVPMAIINSKYQLSISFLSNFLKETSYEKSTLN